MTTWSGRVGAGLDPEVWAFLRADDTELLPYDCAATFDHGKRLAAAGILTADELVELERRLGAIVAGEAELTPDDEDVHSFIERELGELGRKIHAGRSRNDQVVNFPAPAGRTGGAAGRAADGAGRRASGASR